MKVEWEGRVRWGGKKKTTVGEGMGTKSSIIPAYMRRME